MAKRVNGEEIRANQEAAGIPDSKPFISDEPAETGETRIMRCHIDGVLIAEMNMPAAVLAALDYWATDEGIAERNSRPEMREPSGISLGKDEFYKGLDQRKHEVKNRDFPIYEARNDQVEVMRKYAVPGMRGRFLSASRVRDSNGTGDYEIVKAENGDPVKVQGMILGHIPAGLADARNKYYRDKSKELLKQINRKFLDEVGPLAKSDQSQER